MSRVDRVITPPVEPARTRRGRLGALVTMLIASVAAVTPPPVGATSIDQPELRVRAELGAVVASPQDGAGEAYTLVPLRPCRLLDTRDLGPPLPRGHELHLPVAGRCSVPSAAAAVAITITGIEPSAEGWLAAYPGGTRWPGTSVVNLAAGEVRANGTLLQLGDEGEITIRAHAGGHVLVDVTAAFLPSTEGAEGRFVPLAQRRLVDTRSAGRPAPGTAVVVPLPGGVPSDALAVAINLTTAESRGPGFFSAYPTGERRPKASMLNTDAAGQTRAAAAIVPVNGQGFEVFTHGGDHVIVDIAGYFTGPSAPVSDAGRFVPISPTRLVDTRASGPPLYPGGTREWSVESFTAGGGSTVVANLAVVSPVSAGFVHAHPARTTRADASSANVAIGRAVANLAMVPVSTAGMAAYSSGGTHLVIDLTGYFTGDPQPALLGAPSNAPPPQPAAPSRVLFIGDSVAAAFRWAPAAVAHLTGSDFVLDVRACRRTTGASCAVAGGSAPPNTVQAIQSSAGGYDAIVVMTGYNDWYTTFPSAIDQVMAAARAKGVGQVIWLTLRAYRSPTNYPAMNRHLLAATSRHPDLRISDWHHATASRSSWFAADGVHLTSTGAVGLAQFVSAEVARLR